MELYIYWRVTAAEQAAAVAAVRAFQRELALEAPGLQARLLRRADATAGLVTLMETYALPGQPAGVAPPLQRHIVTAGDRISAPWRQGQRHLEVFNETGTPG